MTFFWHTLEALGIYIYILVYRCSYMYINVYIISPGLLNNYISPPNLETLEFTEKGKKGQHDLSSQESSVFFRIGVRVVCVCVCLIYFK